MRGVLIRGVAAKKMPTLGKVVSKEQASSKVSVATAGTNFTKPRAEGEYFNVFGGLSLTPRNPLVD